MASLVELRAGALSMRFCPRLAFLRHVVFHDGDGRCREVVRGIFPAIRNRDWDTMDFQVSDFELDRGPDHFRIGYRAECIAFPFHWRGELIGTTAGQINYRFAGEASGELLKNRIGLCVLHPIEACAGESCRVQHADGTITEGVFPKWISPHQPFRNLSAISHTVLPGVEATVEFEGEIFEMEDQRNWTDASFKTYSTPLELPFPVVMPARSAVNHQVTVRVSSQEPCSAPVIAASTAASMMRVRVDWSQAQSRPAMGLSIATCDSVVEASVMKRLAAMRNRSSSP